MIAKYFWDLKETSLKKTERILRNPSHPRFAQRMMVLLSRCDKPKELFSICPRKEFMDAWPTIRSYWAKRIRRSDSRDWWQTLYEQLARAEPRRKMQGKPSAFFRELGGVIREARIRRGLSQGQLALQLGMKQPDISRIEDGRKNMTLFTLMRLCKVLEIKKVDLS